MEFIYFRQNEYLHAEILPVVLLTRTTYFWKFAGGSSCWMIKGQPKTVEEAMTKVCNAQDANFCGIVAKEESQP
jgi:hypothetical protein